MPEPIERSIKSRLAAGERLLLDGGLGTELEKNGVNVNDALWSGLSVLDQPAELEKVYENYLKAGADLIETATYQLSTAALEQKNIQSQKVYRQSVEIAASAVAKVPERNPGIVGSIGPYGAYLADGSEYTGSYKEIDDVKIAKFHQDRLQDLYLSRDVAVIGLETFPNFDEVKIVLEMLRQLGEAAGEHAKPYYLSVTCSDDLRMVDGTSLHELLGFLDEHLDPNLVAVGTNCCKLSTSLILVHKFDLELSNFSKLDEQVKIIIYPNSGEVYHGDTKTWTLDPKLHTDNLKDAFARAGKEFLSVKRVGIVGGCCRTGPEQTETLRKLIDESTA